MKGHKNIFPKKNVNGKTLNKQLRGEQEVNFRYTDTNTDT